MTGQCELGDDITRLSLLYRGEQERRDWAPNNQMIMFLMRSSGRKKARFRGLGLMAGI